MRKNNIKFTEIVAPHDIISEGLSDIRGGGFWKDLLEGLHLCGSGCSTGKRKPTTTTGDTTGTTSQEQSSEVKP